MEVCFKGIVMYVLVWIDGHVALYASVGGMNFIDFIVISCHMFIFMFLCFEMNIWLCMQKTKDGCRWYCYGWIGSLHPVIVPREEKESEVPCTIYIFCSSEYG